MSRGRFVVGIDLGTTHCCLAYAPVDAPEQVQLLPLLQRVGPGQVAEKSLLPSVRYHPSEEDIAAEGQALPWEDKPVEGDRAMAWVGEYARWLGGQRVGRTVTSAKSWLSHPRVDRTAAILPWSEHADSQLIKVSPIVASASYLAYLVNCWNQKFPESVLNEQHVVVALPASFDDVARVMTRQACRLAGLESVHVIEEPTAACYDWYQSVQAGKVKAPKQLERILVCDVGGGTTDFSLVEVTALKPDLELKRFAVGDHLMLGGDNIDLALAGLVQNQLGQAMAGLSAGQLTQLMAQTRRAKELLLSEKAPERIEVTVLGKGSGLLSAAKTAILEREQVRRTVLEGYFPQVDLQTPLSHGGSAVVAFGLPYARDPAITRHLAAFLRSHLGDAPEDMPNAVIFNGGVFNSPLLRDAMVQVLSQWRQGAVTVLENSEPDYAVARGGVVFGHALLGSTNKITAALPRHYFLVTEGLEQQGICLLPKGAPIHKIHQLGQQFALRVGEPVQMHVVASTSARHYVVGEVVNLAEVDVVALPPLTTCVEADSVDVNDIPVRLSASATDLGTLKLSCQAVTAQASQTWAFEFESIEATSVTQPSSDTRKLPPQTAEPASSSNSEASLPEQSKKLQQAIALIDSIYGKADAKVAEVKAPGQLRSRLEKCLGPRQSWNVTVARAMADHLLALSKRRRRSAQHERVWFWMAGFCLRPGFGAPNDPQRLSQLWPLFEAGLQYETESQNQSQWWLLWRRVCGGLEASEQSLLASSVERLLQQLASGKRKKQNARAAALLKAKQAGQMDAIRLLGLCERLGLEKRQALGDQVLRLLLKEPGNESLWWSLGRLGAREPLYAEPEQCVLAPQIVEKWLDTVFPLLKSQRQIPLETAAFAITQMASQVENQAHNISAAQSERIALWLEDQKMPDRWVAAIRTLQHYEEGQEYDAQDQGLRLGEQLPHGLRLIQA